MKDSRCSSVEKGILHSDLLSFDGDPRGSCVKFALSSSNPQRMQCSNGCPPHQVLNPIGCPRALNDSGVAELSTMQDAIREVWQGESILADSGTEQLEFIALSQRTGDLKYQQKVEKVIRQLQKTYPSDGLLPIYINPHSGVAKPYSTITFGAMGDSFYEYLLKAWIQGNKTEGLKHYREMWETSMEGLVSLIRKSTPSSFSYICEKTGNSLSDKMDELACFAPGMLALGSSGYAPEKAEKMLSLSKEDMSVGTSWNILRPETVESLMYLWRLTGNKTYQEWGWNIFLAFEKNSRIDSGYVGLKDVNTGMKDDMMQSFFLAETLKYLYLLFSPPSVVSLDEWVFNTEAHPLRIIPRTDTVPELGGEDEAKPQSKVIDRRRPFGRKEGRIADHN
ncbi:hypothetical protein ZIOFF_032180 [Zingiber officinale]|uniref:alpha-1,2-Mannosidase n=1 Tax=Zingiber officinale TaxID=94328 RepID=A0A8J5GV66_ZINOF|nr:hypothetical protein ZIOFF_032180 [Zingiber officinale]